ncbi:hypothetical protein PYCCODRAFT_286283 [Trametes coccinea BRFM310]|uniref:Uncharacterized protein n=1 Tax=Trametes coccinea (strain BRFM310) TaxID=1353009 RepID=A0A1Y2IS25_TRAC3|nr:hypothetical protein PYCCODRAFT_286283 [Trametes coccinea BRFM310]
MLIALPVTATVPRILRDPRADAPHLQSRFPSWQMDIICRRPRRFAFEATWICRRCRVTDIAPRPSPPTNLSHRASAPAAQTINVIPHRDRPFRPPPSRERGAACALRRHLPHPVRRARLPIPRKPEGAIANGGPKEWDTNLVLYSAAPDGKDAHHTAPLYLPCPLPHLPPSVLSPVSSNHFRASDGKRRAQARSRSQPTRQRTFPSCAPSQASVTDAPSFPSPPAAASVPLASHLPMPSHAIHHHRHRHHGS